MTISYQWLCRYLGQVQEELPEVMEPERIGKILTSIGLEVESITPFETIQGGLSGVVIGKVLTCEQHPNADKLRLTTVDIGSEAPLQIVCGAPNVAVGQTVAVATVGTTIYPTSGDPLTMKVAKIRGVESHGMICAEDELGIGTSHDGIIILPNDLQAGMPAAEYFKPYHDFVYEIGLTPNRMDAMSHLGVVRDLCAYLNHHFKKDIRPTSPLLQVNLPESSLPAPIEVTIEEATGCKRYAGITIQGVKVAPSPDWLANALRAIGLRPINNLVDITNYILHETGQPLHAFDAAAIKGGKVRVACLKEGVSFITLDEKERKLDATDVMICDAEGPMCIAGVFGGLHSGVTDVTTSIFLESACFDSTFVRRTSLRHGLRTDAATRFEKGVDISQTVQVLKRAAQMIIEIAGGEVVGPVVDVYPTPQPKKEIAVRYHYIKKLSGKNYHPDAIRKILTSLGFDFIKEGMDEMWVAVPFSKTDISHPADIVEEILRIDGLDQIPIPEKILLSPAIDRYADKEKFREKIAQYLAGRGFHEIVTNSITNSKYYSEQVLLTSVKMLNSLSADLDIMRPSLLETGLESISYNLNRKMQQLRFFEIGKTYSTSEAGKYEEKEQLGIWMTGQWQDATWKGQGVATDLYLLKGLIDALGLSLGISNLQWKQQEQSASLQIFAGKQQLGELFEISPKQMSIWDIKQPVYFAQIEVAALLKAVRKHPVVYQEIPKFPSVQRDVAMIIDRQIPYSRVEEVVQQTNLKKLKSTRLFDVFESDKLGQGKKSIAINFTFQDAEKTLTDKEIDSMMNKLMQQLEQQLQAEIRKA